MYLEAEFLDIMLVLVLAPQ
jgi:hypothetical protein